MQELRKDKRGSERKERKRLGERGNVVVGNTALNGFAMREKPVLNLFRVSLFAVALVSVQLV